MESDIKVGATLQHQLQAFHSKSCKAFSCRWIKYEQVVEGDHTRFSKPHITLLSVHGLLQLKNVLRKGTVILEAQANSFEDLVGKCSTYRRMPQCRHGGGQLGRSWSALSRQGRPRARGPPRPEGPSRGSRSIAFITEKFALL